MVFSSFAFLFAFLPPSLVLYYLTPARCKNSVLCLISLIFYALGAGYVFAILLISALADYLIARQFSPSNKRSSKNLLRVGIGLNLLILFYYKYLSFLLVELSELLLPSTAPYQGFFAGILLPIGISFFTFQKISYLVDVYQTKTEPAANFVDYLLFVSLFPQLIAGPIVKYQYLAAQIRQRSHSTDLFFAGVTRFSFGLFKKVCIADILAISANYAFSQPAKTLDSTVALAGIIAYTFQIYFDFAGYSGMAIGIGMMFGFRLPENFNRPYLARNFAQFWQRWHITLGSWMKEYLYIPLGGNRAGVVRTTINLWLVFIASGIWHGANWTFLLWGVWHGFFISISKLSILPAHRFAALKIFTTFTLIMGSWVLFRSAGLTQALNYYSALFSLNTSTAATFFWADFWSNRTTATLILAVILSFTPWQLRQRISANLKQQTASSTAVLGILALLCFVMSVLTLASIGHSPFLYFKF